MTRNEAVDLIERELLTCKECGARVIRLSEYWGCMKAPSHTRLKSDHWLRADIEKLIPEDGTKDRSRYNSALNRREILKTGRDVQLDAIMRQLHLRCGYKAPSLATKDNYRAFQVFKSRYDGAVVAYQCQGYYLAFGTKAELQWTYPLRWSRKHVEFVWRDKEGKITQQVECLLAHSPFDLEGKIATKLQEMGVTCG